MSPAGFRNWKQGPSKVKEGSGSRDESSWIGVGNQRWQRASLKVETGAVLWILLLGGINRLEQLGGMEKLE